MPMVMSMSMPTHMAMSMSISMLTSHADLQATLAMLPPDQLMMPTSPLLLTAACMVRTSHAPGSCTWFSYASFRRSSTSAVPDARASSALTMLLSEVDKHRPRLIVGLGQGAVLAALSSFPVILERDGEVDFGHPARLGGVGKCL